MENPADKRLNNFAVRAQLPRYFRIAAIGALAVSLLVIGFGFYSSRNRAEFHLKSEHTRLSNEVIAEVNGYERLETDGDLRKYLVRAERAVTFSDNHQELDSVYLEIYDDQGVNFDKLSADRGLYIPGENKDFTAYLAGNVDIKTRDALAVQTEHLTYSKLANKAEADEKVHFSRGNVAGSATGAVVYVAEKKLDLLRDVDVETSESAETASSIVRTAHLKSGSATFDQTKHIIELRDGMTANIVTGNRTVDASSVRANAVFTPVENAEPVLGKLELFDSVNIVSKPAGASPTTIDAGYALYDKTADRFELRNGTHILMGDEKSPTSLTATEGAYDQANFHVTFNGNVEITQAQDLIKGEHVDAYLFPDRTLKSAVSQGNAYLKQASAERTTEVSADQIDATFKAGKVLTAANTRGESNAVITPAQAAEYSRVSLNAPIAIHIWFRGEGAIDRAQTDGRTSIQLNVLDSSADAANKRLTADAVRTFFDSGGRSLEKAEAIGNAELYVEPLHPGPENYKTKIEAPRFDCDFFPNSNSARNCIGGVKTKTTRTPTQPTADRGVQTMASDRLTAVFDQHSKDIQQLDAAGKAKFNELDRNGTADKFTFTAGDATVRLRGGEPMAWDSAARIKANEIDWDTKNQTSSFRGKVATTYYNQKQTGGATPFSDPGKPVYLTSDAARIDHRAQSARYVGNTRGWQEKNYVRADSFLIDQINGRFVAEGNVQSLLYDAVRRENGKESTVPVFASAGNLSYARDSRVLHYENDVDIRQGTDRMLSQVANIFLNDRNEMVQSIAERNVVITQPNRRATGEYAQYISAEETVTLRGNPATVNDAENGSSQGAEVKVYLKENRVLGEGKSKQNPTGRIRSVYKVKNN